MYILLLWLVHVKLMLMMMKNINRQNIVSLSASWQVRELMVTAQLTDMPTLRLPACGLVNLRTGQLADADWT